MSLEPAERKVMLALVQVARDNLNAGHRRVCEDTLTKARARFGEASELHDVWSELCEQQGDTDGVLSHLRRAWDLEPSTGRGLALSTRLPPDQRKPFLRDLLARFEDEAVVIALVRAELMAGGFEAGASASSLFVEKITGGSKELREALAKVVEGQDPEGTAMPAFLPLVSAEIESRVRLERRAAGEEVDDDETATEMLIAATLSIPPKGDNEVHGSKPEAASTAAASLDTVSEMVWLSPWLDGIVAIPGILVAIPFALFLHGAPFAQYWAMALTIFFCLLGVAASARGRSTGHLPSEGDFDLHVTVVMAPFLSFLIGVALLGVSSIVLDWANPTLLERMGLLVAAGLAWGGSSVLGLRLTS